MAQAAQRRFHLDAIYFIPSSRPPHKTELALTPFVHRYAMVALACADHPAFVPSLAEAELDGAAPHVFYTIDTVRRFRREHPDDHLYLHCRRRPVSRNSHLEELRSAARFLRFHHRQPSGIPPGRAAAGHPAGKARAHDGVEDPHKIVLRKSVIHLLTTVASHVSSTEIRERLEKRTKHPRACARARGGIHSRTGPVPVTLDSLRPEIRWAVEAAQDKQAVDITVLKLSGAGAFAEYFLLCSGQSPPQIQAIGEAIEERLAARACAWRIAKGRPARNGCCSITALSSCTSSANARANTTISNGCGAPPSASIFPRLRNLPNAQAGSERRHDAAMSADAHSRGWRPIRRRSASSKSRKNSPKRRPRC